MKEAGTAGSEQTQAVEQAKACLAQVSVLSESWSLSTVGEENDANILDEIILQCDEAANHFKLAAMNWMAIWTMLLKTDILAAFAHTIRDDKRNQIVRKAVVLVQNAMLEIIQLDGPNMKTLRALHLALINSLFNIRAMFDQAAQIDAIDALIKEASRRYGEIEAWNISIRSQANDQLLIAAVLNSMQEYEQSPAEIEELTRLSQETFQKGIHNLRFSGGLNSSASDVLIQKAAGAGS